MPTYDNPRNGVVHWVEPRAAMTACNFLRVVRKSKHFDLVGSHVDVGCCHCRETATWLDAAQKEFDLRRKYDALVRGN